MGEDNFVIINMCLPFTLCPLRESVCVCVKLSGCVCVRERENVFMALIVSLTSPASTHTHTERYTACSIDVFSFDQRLSWVAASVQNQIRLLLLLASDAIVWRECAAA